MKIKIKHSAPCRLSFPGGPYAVERGRLFALDAEAFAAWLETSIGRAMLSNGWLHGANGEPVPDKAAALAMSGAEAPAEPVAPSKPAAPESDDSGPVVRVSYSEIEACDDADTLAHWATGANLSKKKRDAIEARLAEVLKG